MGLHLEVVTGKSYVDYLQQNILAKVGLYNTNYIDSTKNILNVPEDYSRFDGKLETASLQNITTIYAAGGIMSNTEDLFKWHQALYKNKLVNRDLLM